MGFVKELDHIGIAVEDLDSSVELFTSLFDVEVEREEIVEGQKVRLATMKIGSTHLELLESTDPEGPIGKFIQKRGQGLHHITLRVDNIDSALKDLKEKGVELIDEEPRTGEGGSKIAFIHPKSTGSVLIELVER